MSMRGVLSPVQEVGGGEWLIHILHGYSHI
jgi:hypothetical protein